jgi:hypothetical protein
MPCRKFETRFTFLSYVFESLKPFTVEIVPLNEFVFWKRSMPDKENLADFFEFATSHLNLPSQALDRLYKQWTAQKNYVPYDPNKCFAKIDKGGTLIQCSRSHAHNCQQFCMTHYKQKQTGVLKGEFDFTGEINVHPQTLEVASEKIERELSLIYVKQIPYLYDSATNEVFDYRTYLFKKRVRQVGVLNADNSITKIHVL